MFTGSHQLTIDDKGRLAVPARFRQQLLEDHGPQLYITRAYNQCLEIYPAETFHSLALQIQNLEDRAAADRLKDLFIGSAVDVELDKQGRILLPQNLREFALINSSVTVVGQITRIDVWDAELRKQHIGIREGDAAMFTQFKR